MLKLSIKQLTENTETLLKMMTLSSKVAILLGGVCISAYSLRIGYVPQGLTVGDGLLFMLAAACFGAIYLFFTVSLVSLGVCLSPVVRLAVSAYLWTFRLRDKPQPVQVYEFAEFRAAYLPLAGFAGLFIFLLGRTNTSALWNLPILSLGLYLFYSAYLSSGHKLKCEHALLGSLVKVDREQEGTRDRIESLRKVQVLSLAVLIAIPLFAGGVTGQLLDAAMRGANLRMESATVFVKGPYAALLPAQNRSSLQPLQTQAEYLRFDNVSVLFRGLGGTSVLAFKDQGAERRLEVPNDQLIIEKKP